MKRLIRVGLGLFAFSLFPILSWLVLAVTLGEPEIANVFSLTYPIQFIWSLLKAIFGTGANIKRNKENDENAVLSSMTLGIFVGAIVFGLLALFIEPYIKFMSMDVAFYKNFAIYSVLQLFIQYSQHDFQYIKFCGFDFNITYNKKSDNHYFCYACSHCTLCCGASLLAI